MSKLLFSEREFITTFVSTKTDTRQARPRWCRHLVSQQSNKRHGVVFVITYKWRAYCRTRSNHYVPRWCVANVVLHHEKRYPRKTKLRHAVLYRTFYASRIRNYFFLFIYNTRMIIVLLRRYSREERRIKIKTEYSYVCAHTRIIS